MPLPRRGGRRTAGLAALVALSLALLAILAPAAAAASPPAPLAGMRPHPVLTDLAKFRLQTISFFVVVLLASAGFVKLAWNHLRRDWAALPRLTYGKAVGVVLLWGLLFVIVLAMISGARELMTPGAWERRADGGYRLAGAPPAADPAAERQRKMEALRDALWAYAAANGGRFPPHEFAPGVPADAWVAPHPAGLRYVYVPGRRADAGPGVVAYEPGTFSGERLTLHADGRIEKRPVDDVREELFDEAYGRAADERPATTPSGEVRP